MEYTHPHTPSIRTWLLVISLFLHEYKVHNPVFFCHFLMVVFIFPDVRCVISQIVRSKIIAPNCRLSIAR